MYIGKILDDICPSFYRAGTDILLEPERVGDSLVLRWDRIFDTQVDIKYSFGRHCYVGAVEMNISGDSGKSLFVDGVKIACHGKDTLIPVNHSGEELVIRIRGNLDDLVVSSVEVFGFYPDDDEPLMIPRPHRVDLNGGKVAISGIVGEGDAAAFASEFLTSSLEERYASLSDGEGVVLRFELCPEYENERYTVDVSEEGAVIKAASRLALLWGACRVIDLWDDGKLPIISIDDKPDVPMRGFHMGLPRADRIDFTKKLFRYVLLPLGYNHVILEFNGNMRYDKHPEISEKWIEAEKLFREGKRERIAHAEMGADGTVLEKHQVRELVSVLEDFGIEAIPEVQILSHVQYLLNAHPELSELTAYKAANAGEALSIVHPHHDDHGYCPEREDSMRYAYDIIDEVVDVVCPNRYVHIGHDEAYHLGFCPKCAKKGAIRVFIDHVIALYNHMKSKGLGIMMWSDALHTDLYYTDESHSEIKLLLPKDILLLDFSWYYHLDKDIEDDILTEGHNVMMGNLYSSHYPRYSNRIAKKGMIGGQTSTWIAVSEAEYAKNGKFFDLVYLSEMLWNAYTYDERNRVSYNALIGQCILPEMRDLMHGKYNLYLAANIEDADALGVFQGDNSRIPEELAGLYLTEPKEKLTIGAKYDRLIFEHATLNPMPRVAWKQLCTVGHYTVSYADGTSEDIPVEYAGGILYWKSLYGMPMPQRYYRHQGYVGTWRADPTYESRTAEGEPVLLLGQVWDNPAPHKVIADIVYTPAEGEYAGLISGGVYGVSLD